MRCIRMILAGLACAVLASGEAAAQTDPRTATASPRVGVPAGSFQLDQPCPCQDGHWYDANRKSCVTGTGCKVPGMPNGDKGGKYFAWDGNLFLDTPCKPCERLELPLATGTAQWIVADGPDASFKGKPAMVVQAVGGWGSIAGAKWIRGAANEYAPGGDYRYELRFCLCPEFKNARLSLNVLADNSLTVLLNGKEIGKVPGPKGFLDPPKPFATSSHFQAGQNVLTVVVNNLPDSPTGLLVGGSITADAGRCR